MKALLICEYRDGKLLESSYELFAFADKLNAEKVALVIGSDASVPSFSGKVYLADVAKYGEYNPEAHKKLVLDVVGKENPDIIVLVHTSYGWDLAPRIAAALKAAQVSEVVNVVEGGYEVSCLNGKMRRIVSPKTDKKVITIQSGAFTPQGALSGNPEVVKIDLAVEAGNIEFLGYEVAEKTGVDLSKAEVIVSAGRGVGKKDNMPIIEALAKALGGEVGATRPVVDAGWLEQSRQVGITGQTVSPKLYIACGISGAVQHIAGMKKSDFVVAINKDKDAPIGEVADVLVVADVLQFVPALTEKLQK
ncbi:MAG: electron transfer flavoprotein subunit alpha/FixB family protein [bacterium]